EGTRSEFHYGSFYRSMPLPAGAKEDDIAASYTDGILTVTMPVTESPTPEKHIEITKTDPSGDKTD
ncbi:putative small heat shock protein, partial [Rhodococcus opacus M213]